MPVLGRVIFSLVHWAARNGLQETSAATAGEQSQARPASGKLRAQRTGVRGETYAYWYLRRHGYVMMARNFSSRGMKGEIDLVGYDGATLAFVEVKTRTGARRDFGVPEDAVSQEKQRHLARVAKQFLREYHVADKPFRFDVLAIESPPGQRPLVRLHKGAFAG